jgi:hypothetical protein
MFALLLGSLDVALGIGGYVRYLGSGRRGAKDQPAEQDSKQSLASSHPVCSGTSKVAVRGADCR